MCFPGHPEFRFAVAVLAMVMARMAFGEVGFRRSTHQWPRSGDVPLSASGITYAGGKTYYVVADDGGKAGGWAEVGLYRLDFDVRNGAPVHMKVGKRIVLEGATDLEAVAYDPLTHNVWAANETGNKTIREYDPETGKALATLDVPPIMLGDYGNLGFESLAISADGRTLWTANEESLMVDGPKSSYAASSTNRLVKFTRADGTQPWKLAAMYPYVTDRWHRPFGLGGLGRRGISDMCALPDGSLLVLERELSASSDGSGFAAKLTGTFYISIYRLTPEALAAATDVRDIASLAKGGWKPVVKGRPIYDSGMADGEGLLNWEGLCLGARFGTTQDYDLVLLTDAGDGYTSPRLVVSKLLGLEAAPPRVVAASPPQPQLPPQPELLPRKLPRLRLRLLRPGRIRHGLR